MFNIVSLYLTDGYMEKIELNKEEYQNLKIEYEKAIKENKIQFTFQDKLFLTGYAKYLLEHLKDKFE